VMWLVRIPVSDSDGHAAEVDVLEVIAGGRGQGFYVGDVEAVSDPICAKLRRKWCWRRPKPVAVLDVVSRFCAPSWLYSGIRFCPPEWRPRGPG